MAKDSLIQIRISEFEKIYLKNKAEKAGFKSLTEFILSCVLSEEERKVIENGIEKEFNKLIEEEQGKFNEQIEQKKKEFIEKWQSELSARHKL